jgi:hypothetical protein
VHTTTHWLAIAEACRCNYALQRYNILWRMETKCLGRKAKLPFSLRKRVQKTFRKTEKAKQNAHNRAM